MAHDGGGARGELLLALLLPGWLAPACHLEKVNTTNALQPTAAAVAKAAVAATTIAITMTALRGRESLLETPSRWQWQHQQHGREMAALQLPAGKDYGLRTMVPGSPLVLPRCIFIFPRSPTVARRPSLCHSGLFCGLKTNFRS